MTTGCAPIPTDDHGDILYVDFIDGKPCSVLTTESGYDFDWCKRDKELLYHASGGGIRPGKEHTITQWCDNKGKSFWAADCLRLRIRTDWDHDAKSYRVDEEATPEALAKHGLKRRARIKNPFRNANEAYYGIDYCSVCDDHFDRDSTCHHIWDGPNGQTGPGGDDGIAGLKDCFLRFCAIAGITRRLRKGLVPFAIRTSQLHAVGGLGPSFVDLYVCGKDLGDIARKFDRHDVDGLSDAASLLFSLDEKTTSANALVRQWLDEAVAAQDKRRASYERCYVVTDDDQYACEETLAEDKWHRYLDQQWTEDGTPTGTVFGTRNQRHASRMSWKEASALAKRLNGDRFRKDYFVRHLRPRNEGDDR